MIATALFYSQEKGNKWGKCGIFDLNFTYFENVIYGK
jgi:hypothetical protein